MQRRGWTVAGAGLLAVSGIVLWTERPHLWGDASADAAKVDQAVPAGQGMRTVVLSDGSEVVLAPGSRLRSRGAFGADSRELELTGEALFTVAAADAPGTAPFIVHGNGVDVEDLGTAFVLRTVAGRLLVSVTQGMVQVSRARTVLHEGEAQLVDSTGQVERLSVTDARGSLAWTSGALLFHEEPLTAVVERLERWTGRTIVVDADLATRRLTAAFESGTPDEIVDQLAAMTGARVEFRDGRWFVSRALMR
ncbi:FecR family protein [Gemmatimonas sp.]|jgi:transmembrane sensor|uniref:FecR family protein n=1 Tax=Gemmatimonas sp. TaxID=1962908 RepID=UPI00391B5C2D